MSWSNNGGKDLHQESKGGKIQGSDSHLTVLEVYIKAHDY